VERYLKCERESSFARHHPIRRRVAVILSLIATGGVVGAFIYFRKPITCKLSDGTIFTVWKLTVGTHHACNPRGPLGLKLERWIPERFDWLLGSPNFGPGFSTGSDSLAVWAAVWDPTNRQYRPAGQLGRVELVDSHGCVFSANGWGTCSGRGTNPVVASCFFFSAFPRRSREFALRLYDNAGNFDRDLRLRNPARRSSSEWRAERLPATRLIGDLQVVLEQIETRPAGPSKNGKPGRFIFLPQFSLIQNDKPAVGWTLEHSGFCDATGNWGKALCTHEPAWKTMATLWPTADACLPSNQMVHVGPLLLPAAAEQRAVVAPPAPGKLPARILAIAGPGQYTWSNDLCVASAPLRQLDPVPAIQVNRSNQVLRVSRTRHHLVFKNASGGRGKNLFVRGRDDQGRSVIGTFAGGDADLQFYDLELPADAASIDLRLIPREPVTVEFFVKPPSSAREAVELSR
jgi:hypothetical protein